MILVFDDQHNLWTNVFASVYVFSSLDAKVTWTKALRKQHLKRRHYEDHKWRSISIKQSPRHEETCCHWRIVRLRAPDYAVHQGTVAQWLVPGGTMEESHQTVRCKADSANDHLPDPTASGAPDMAPDCPVPTAGLFGVPQRAVALLQRLYLSCGLYILHPTGHLKVWEPKQYTKTYCTHFHVLIHPSA
jgi:hypothetical protein